ncbi:MAG: beta-ketoacyl-ACP synthase II [Fusobacteriaceae bacterium]
MRRVVVTGIGMISSLGNSTKETWEKINLGETGVDYITAFDTENMPVKIAAEVKNFDPTQYGIEKKEIKKLARNTQFAIAASKMALEDSGLIIDETNRERVGVIVSSGIGGMEVFEEQHKTMLEKGVKRISPFTIPAMISNMAAGNVAIYLGAQGPNKAVVTACAAGTHSIGDAFETIKLGRADAMIAGGTEAAITPFALNGFANMKALSTRNDSPKTASRPFTLDRDGFVMGEGAGVLIIEELESAKARGAKIYAEIVGYGETCDAYHITSPSEGGTGAARAIKMALNEANVDYKSVDYVNAHGTSTPANDRNETAAIKSVFGEHAKTLVVSSTKGATGHCLGAAGGIEAGFLALAIKEGIIPPTINYETPDSECDLNYVPNKTISKEIEVGISTSLGFGGHNGVIAMRKYR